MHEALFRGDRVIRWTEAYATGIEEIDNQHRMLFRIVEDYRLAYNEGRGCAIHEQVVNLLAAYARGHFGFEENCMHAHRCPLAAINKSEHAHFLQFIERAKDQYRLHGYKEQEAGELMNTLENWLVKHIANVDIHLKDCVTR